MTRGLTSAVPLTAMLVALFMSSAGIAAESQPQPFATGNPTAGKAMVDKDCIDCHARRFDGNADRMYLRGDHRVRNPAQLMTQVQACNVQLGTRYFPEEEEHIAAYLNLHYYKFKP